MVLPAAYNNLSPVYTEYNVGNYFRQFALNEDIDESRIQARMRNGVLEVELLKREHAKPRRSKCGRPDLSQGRLASRPLLAKIYARPNAAIRAARITAVGAATV